VGNEEEEKGVNSLIIPSKYHTCGCLYFHLQGTGLEKRKEKGREEGGREGVGEEGDINFARVDYPLQR